MSWLGQVETFSVPPRMSLVEGIAGVIWRKTDIGPGMSRLPIETSYLYHYPQIKYFYLTVVRYCYNISKFFSY